MTQSFDLPLNGLRRLRPPRLSSRPAAAVQASPQLDKLAAAPIWTWVETRLDLVWFAIYLAIQRLVVLFAWTPWPCC